MGTATYGIKSDVAWRVEEEEALKHLQVGKSRLSDYHWGVSY
jgi:hypothetical protein